MTIAVFLSMLRQLAQFDSVVTDPARTMNDCWRSEAWDDIGIAAFGTPSGMT
jgi:hypothetical protein